MCCHNQSCRRFRWEERNVEGKKLEGSVTGSGDEGVVVAVKSFFDTDASTRDATGVDVELAADGLGSFSFIGD